ncbi:MAG TPA: hypothetical protein VN969_47320 [Streptosporangiaceae bacterium]|nr:hypothetical protein [Streptosporangiaceae bacterium]
MAQVVTAAVVAADEPSVQLPAGVDALAVPPVSMKPATVPATSTALSVAAAAAVRRVFCIVYVLR